ncbi:MAG: hypothetical protein AAF529_17600 [Pseudomonadota bacterium]
MDEYEALSEQVKAMRVTQALKETQRALVEHADLRESWQANIACAIMDTEQQEGESDHDWRNRCAKTFLNRFAPTPELTAELASLPGFLASQGSVEPPA